MKIILDADDIKQLLCDESVELDSSVFLKIGLEEAVKKSIGEHTASGGSLRKEIRKQVDDYINSVLPVLVGNYVRTQDHTANRIITTEIKKEVEKGIRSGIERYAEKKSKQIADLLAEDKS